MSDSPKRRALLRDRSPRTRSVLLATGVLVVAITPFAAAKTGDALLQGKRNGTTVSETEIISNVASTNALKGGYSTRQSNLSASGGGAIYGCRSQAGGSKATPTPQNPCLRVNNLSKGLAFELQATNGDLGGTIQVGGGGDAAKPFTTNATGVATGLNADRVDGKGAEDIAKDALAAAQALAPFAQVNDDGTARETRGVATNGIGDPAGSGVQDITFNGDLSKCALQATITGPSAGMVAVSPTVAANKATTTVGVRTYNAAGNLTDRGFHLSASC
jgi:hypothetical protein